MSTPRFVADLHMGHRNIYKYRPVFKSTLHNDYFFMEVLESVCTKRDIMYFLGDILFDKKYLGFIKSLPGTKILIPGNHCTEYISMKELANTFDDVHASLKKNGFWLTHIPIHDDELRGKPNIHGHVHASSIESPNHLNVSVDSSFMKYYPRTLAECRYAIEHQQEHNTYFPGISNFEAEDVILGNSETSEIYKRTLNKSKNITV